MFYVAFSGGKDSIVTLDLVQRALPHDEFMVLFGDTGMEFPDTYDTVEFIKSYCTNNGIRFIRSQSDIKPEVSWKCFGPPATVNRWCCSVHKTSPQILALRNETHKKNFTGMAFIGVRASESAARSEYDYISLGEKHKGQWSFNPILDWNTAELFIYTYAQSLYINDAYKRGNRRAGCLMCPRAAERSDYFSRVCYPAEFDELLNAVKYGYELTFPSKTRLDEFVINGGWKARKNGRDLRMRSNYSEEIVNGNIILTINHPRTDWLQWIKTIGILEFSENDCYAVLYQSKTYNFKVYAESDRLTVGLPESISKQNPEFVKLFKNVFRKAASCIGCRTCEADCHNGSLHIHGNDIYIDDSCMHCTMCHKVEKGCLVYKSLELPKGLNMNNKTVSLNCYSHHAPKLDWFEQFFKYGESFPQNNSLGSSMFDFFKRFLKDADLFANGHLSTLYQPVYKLGLADQTAWALMLAQLTYSPQFNWFVRNLNFSEEYNREYIVSRLVEDGAKDTWANDIWSSFSRIGDLPFAQVGFGTMRKEGKKSCAISRQLWADPDARVVLFSLYKFAEACGDYYQFTLTNLLDDSIERDGVSPSRIFGIDRQQMERILNGLATNYPEYLSVAFTLDLDNITLREDKTSEDVLSLF